MRQIDPTFTNPAQVVRGLHEYSGNIEWARQMGDAIFQWVYCGRPPGRFLQSVLCNDLIEATGRADPGNRVYLCELVKFLFNEVPSICFGSPQKVVDWCDPDFLDQLASPECTELARIKRSVPSG